MLTLILSIAGSLVLAISIFLTIHTRFIQFRALPELFRLFFRHKHQEGDGTICARRALFTAMSTTIGLSTMVAPVIAIKLGGPGAVFGFFLATLFGAATSYTEVTFALKFRKRIGDQILGGPMQYLQQAFSPFLAKWYAFFCGILMVVWSAAQANQVADLFSASIAPWLSGVILAIGICILLIGGIKRIAAFSARLVPLMFCLYLGASFVMIALNVGRLPDMFVLIMRSCFEPQALGGGALVGGLVSSFRWGILKGLHGTEAGVGTQTIPHSVAEVANPSQQGVMAMASTFSSGLIMIISSITALLSMTLLDDSLGLGINMVVATFTQTFSIYGAILVGVCALLFAFGTILGNSYNGSQCYLYLTKGRGILLYYLITVAMIFVGAIGSVQTVWSSVDIVLVLVTVPHVLALLWLSLSQKTSLVSSTSEV